MIEVNAIVVGLVVGLTEIAKSAGLPIKFAPLISTIIGMLAGLLVIGFTIPAVISGLISGLVASGLWDLGKSALKND